MNPTTLDDLTEPAPPASDADWNDQGVVVLPSFLPGALIDAYEDEWNIANGPVAVVSRGLGQAHLLQAASPHGWADCTPYMRHSALRDLCTYGPLAEQLEGLIGEPAGVHLNLTGWVTTERDWHQDSYLNPPHVGDAYAAVWMALGDVHPDSGPFQYVRGSHRWPQVTRERILHALGESTHSPHPDWPRASEQLLSPLFEAEIARRGADVVTYVPRRGDVLIWHGRLLHRGTKAVVASAHRPALIAHYSGIYHRNDMPRPMCANGAGWYFPVHGGPVR